MKNIYRGKGVIDIEFIIAVFVFLGSISFTTLVIGREFFSIREASVTEAVKLRVNGISQLLLFDRGEPADWETIADDTTLRSTIKRLGLASGSIFVMDSNKINRLRSFCDTANPSYNDNYNKIRDLLGVQGDIVLDLTDTEGAQILRCGPSLQSLTRPKLPAEAHAVINSNKKIVRFTATLVI